jgi:hypothetical protein
MKREIKALWLEKADEEQEQWTSLSALASHISRGLIGFIPEGETARRMVVISDSRLTFIAISKGTRWSDEQNTIEGRYYKFDTYKELLQWMIEGEGV